MKKPVCKTCEGPVLYGNLYCSQACENIAKASDAAHIKQLEQHGFVRDPEIQNVWLKDGVAMTLEHVRHIGVTEAIERHLAAVMAHKGAN